MSLITKGEVAMGDETTPNIYLNSEDMTLDLIQGEDNGITQVSVTQAQYDAIKALGIDEV